MKLWGGRFTEPADDALRALNDSIGYDRRMYAEDITGSIAYAEAIADAEVITAEEAQTIISGLEQVRAEFDDGTFQLADGDEDIHTAVERRLTEIVGPVGGKLHTGRSRNDQVATDFRMWTMAAVDRLDAGIQGVQEVIVQVAEDHVETLIPGYTHLQPAQTITVAHWLMSFFWMLDRDRQRLAQAKARMAVLPLGSGALAGTPYPINRRKLADKLGFTSYSQNSLDGVSDRDFVAEVLFSIALCNTHLSRLAEDIILYSNPLFGFITLSDRFSTGSSLMPQKRNADPMELVRGRAGRVIGFLAGFLTTLKGLPSSYDKDLQEDKETLFGAVDSLLLLLPTVAGTLETITINPDKTVKGLTDDMLATDLADYLVKKGVPFREAHHIVGQVVQVSVQSATPLRQLPLEQLQSISPKFDADVAACLDFAYSASARKAPGGTAPEAVREQIAQAKQHLIGE